MSTGAVSSIVEQLDEVKGLIDDNLANNAAAVVRGILSYDFVISMVATELGHGTNVQWVAAFTSELGQLLGSLFLNRTKAALQHLEQAQAMLKSNELSPDPSALLAKI